MDSPDKLAARVKSPHQQRVEAFMRLAKQEVPSSPAKPDESTRVLRAKLIFEEAMETINALGVQVCVLGRNSGPVIESGGEFYTAVNFPEEGRGDVSPTRMAVVGDCVLEAVADGCADLRVVTTGTLSACGIADEVLQQEVDYNNLTKFGEGHRLREDGKLIKPPGHRPPDIEGVLRRQEGGDR